MARRSNAYRDRLLRRWITATPARTLHVRLRYSILKRDSPNIRLTAFAQLEDGESFLVD